MIKKETDQYIVPFVPVLIMLSSTVDDEKNAGAKNLDEQVSRIIASQQSHHLIKIAYDDFFLDRGGVWASEKLESAFLDIRLLEYGKYVRKDNGLPEWTIYSNLNRYGSNSILVSRCGISDEDYNFLKSLGKKIKVYKGRSTTWKAEEEISMEEREKRNVIL